MLIFVINYNPNHFLIVFRSNISLDTNAPNCVTFPVLSTERIPTAQIHFMMYNYNVIYVLKWEINITYIMYMQPIFI